MTIACLLLLVAPRLLFQDSGLWAPGSLTIQGKRCVATFDEFSADSTDVFEVDVKTGRMSRRKIAGKGWVFSLRGGEVVATQLPGLRFDPPKTALASTRRRRDVLALGDSTVVVFDDQLVAVREDEVLWSMKGGYRGSALGETADATGFFLLGEEEGRVALRRFDGKGEEVSEGVRLPESIQGTGYPFVSVRQLDDDHVVTYVRYTDDYYASHPMPTRGLQGVPQELAQKEYGYISSVVRVNVRTGETEEAGRFAFPYNWHWPRPYRGTLAVRDGMAYAWLLGELYEFDFRRR